MIFKNSVLLAFLSGISVLLGIVRDRLLAHYVGVGPVLDVYNASFRIPDLALGIMLSFATASTVIPFLTKDHKENNKEALEARFTTLLFFFSSVIIVILSFVAVTLPLYAHKIVPGFTSAQLADFIFYTRLLLLQPLLLGVSSLISCLAQLRNEFILYGIAPLLYTTFIILGTIFAYTSYGLSGLMIFVVIGAIFHVGFQSITLYKVGFKLRRKLFSFHYVKEHMHISIPRSGTYIVAQLRVLFYTGFATTLGAGILSAFLFAQKITDALAQMLAQSVSSASLPLLSEYYELDEHVKHRKIVVKYAVTLFALGSLISLVLFMFTKSAVTLLYGHTAMNDTIGFFLTAFAVGLPLQVTAYYLCTAFNSMKKTRVVFNGNAFATILSVIVCLMYKNSGIISLSYGVIVFNATYFLTIAFSYARYSYLKYYHHGN